MDNDNDHISPKLTPSGCRPPHVPNIAYSHERARPNYWLIAAGFIIGVLLFL